MKASTSHDHKAKSLLAWWFSSHKLNHPQDESTNKKGSDPKGGDESWTIECQSLVVVNATVGVGSTKCTKPFNYRVLGVYDRSYNKYYVTGNGKVWRSNMNDAEKRKFKLALRMVKKDAVGTYVDVPMDDCTDGIGRRDIVRLVDGTMVQEVKSAVASILLQVFVMVPSNNDYSSAEKSHK